jgi:ABC-2 type transport system permease protein
MANLVDYVQKGKAALIFDDPFPWVFNTGFGVANAPRQPKPSPGGMGMMQFQQPQAPPKADGGKATSLLNVLEVAWDNGEIVWDKYNPHPEFAEVPPEFVFISPKNGVSSAFSSKSDITSGLQEMLAAFTGTIRPRSDSRTNFEPLLRTGTISGLLSWDEFTEPSFDMTRFTPTVRLADERKYFQDQGGHVIAAHITSQKEPKVNVVYVADIDLISDWFFYERNRGESGLLLDNVTFVLNAVDVLADDTSYIDLRKRRPSHRTLQEVEKQNQEFRNSNRPASGSRSSAKTSNRTRASTGAPNRSCCKTSRRPKNAAWKCSRPTSNRKKRTRSTPSRTRRNAKSKTAKTRFGCGPCFCRRGRPFS